MSAKRFQRRVSAKVIVAGTAAIIACFALGHAHAQPAFVNPPPPPPPPTLNPSTPYTVQQPPYVPVAPSSPSGLSGVGAPSGPNVNVPRSVGQTHRASIAPRHHLTLRHHRRHRRQFVARAPGHHWRYGTRFVARVPGPSYFPGLGILYPPYPDPCHWRRKWSGPEVGYWEYACS